MLCCPVALPAQANATHSAPLAQLAEQLTLNQLGSAINPEENGDFEESAAPGAARSARKGYCDDGSDAPDPSLQSLVDAWPGLPEAAQAAILAIVCESTV